MNITVIIVSILIVLAILLGIYYFDSNPEPEPINQIPATNLRAEQLVSNYLK